MERIGKIARLSVGFKGEHFGISIHISGERWGASDFIGGRLSRDPPPGENLDDYIDDRAADFAATMEFMARICTESGVPSIAGLIGKPVAAIFENDQLSAWRILTEAIG